MKKIRTAIIGMGGRGFHFADMYNSKAHPGFDLKAVCDINPQCFKRVKAEFGENTTCHTDMYEMLKRDDIDAVIIATNDPDHAEPTVAALKAGKHVLCEKPLCQTVDDAKLVLSTASSSQGIFMIGFELREATVFKTMNLNDNSEMCISYANGGKATFHECHFTPEYSREFWFVGTKGKMYGYYDNPGRFLVRIEYSHSSERETEEFKPKHTGGSHGGGDNNLRDEFYRRIIENDPPTETFESAYYSTALAICAEESVDSGMPVNIPGY